MSLTEKAPFYWRDLWHGVAPKPLVCRCLQGIYPEARCENVTRLPNNGMWAGNVFGWWPTLG